MAVKKTCFFMCVLLCMTLVLTGCIGRNSNLYQVYEDDGPIETEVGERKETAVVVTAGLADSSLWDFARIAAFWRETRQDVGLDYIGLVDAGGALRGDMEEMAAFDRLDLMNFLAYEAAAIDASALSQGVRNFLNRANVAQFPMLCAHLVNEENGFQPLSSWAVGRYGDLSLAYIGVCRPEELQEEDGLEGEPLSFSMMEEDWIYAVRDAAESARNSGADYVIVLGSLGSEAANELLSQTAGIDLVLDAAAESESVSINNIRGEAVPVCRVYAGAETMTCLRVSVEGTLTVEYVTGYGEEDPEVIELLESWGHVREAEESSE